MYDSVYPVPRGPASPGGPSRLLAARTDPVVSQPASILQGKTQDVLTVRQPVLQKFVPPANVALTSNVIIQGRPQSQPTERKPFLVPVATQPPVLPIPTLLQGKQQILAGTDLRLPKLNKLAQPAVVTIGNAIYIPTFRPRRR